MVTQYWQVLNIDKRETLGPNHWGEMHDLMTSGAPDALVYHLFTPPPNNPNNNPNDRPSNPDNPNDPDAHLHPPHDGPGNWSGDHIVIISDYALTYPEGMLTQNELDEIEDMYLDSDDGEDGVYEYEDPAPTLYAFAEEWYAAAPVKFLTDDADLGRFENAEEQREGKEGIGEKKEETEKESEGVYLLRNLTKNEYVRSDVVRPVCPDRIVNARGVEVDEEAGVGGGNVVAPGLGHALLVLSCWTSEAPEKFGAVEVGRGKWAGDPVEVTFRNGLELEQGKDKDAEGMEWKDVSEEVAKVLDGFWKSVGTAF